MKRILTTAVTFSIVAALSACGQNMPPNLDPTASPSASGSPSASPSPSADASASPSPEVSASPEASASPSAGPTPFPTGTPMPSSTPLPTPTPVFGSSATPSPENVMVSFRARVITEAREVLPVVNTSFVANPYNLAQLQAMQAQKNGVEAKPLPPQQSDAKYQVEEKVCTSSGCTTRKTVNNTAFQEDLQRYSSVVLPEWEGRAYQGLDAAIQAASGGRENVAFTTNQDGEASLRLLTGTWYFNGRYTVNGTVVVWESVPFEIQRDTQAVELTR